MTSNDGNNLSKEFRSCRTLNLTEEDEYIGKIHEAVGDTLVEYYSYLSNNNIIVPRISGWQAPCLLHYRKGDFLKEHNDSGPENLRTLSVILNLSDKHEGGYFSFFGDRLRLS